MTEDSRELFAESLRLPGTDAPQSDATPTLPAYMNVWRWEDMAWPDKVGKDSSKILLEALRRAVDIRDKPSEFDLPARPVMLVAVLDQLCEVLDVNGSDLWDLSD